MNLTHATRDTWTAPDGTLFLDQRAAERYVAHQQLAATILQRYSLVDADGLMPPITVNSLTQLILSLTFDQQFKVDATDVTEGKS